MVVVHPLVMLCLCCGLFGGYHQQSISISVFVTKKEEKKIGIFQILKIRECESG
jgi:hypothetical protein